MIRIGCVKNRINLHEKREREKKRCESGRDIIENIINFLIFIFESYFCLLHYYGGYSCNFLKILFFQNYTKKLTLYINYKYKKFSK